MSLFNIGVIFLYLSESQKFQAPIVNRTIFEFRRDVRNKVL